MVFTCTSCGAEVAQLNRRLRGSDLILLEECGGCGGIADPYCDRTLSIVLLDALLMRERALLGLLYNRTDATRRLPAFALCTVVLLLCSGLLLGYATKPCDTNGALLDAAVHCVVTLTVMVISSSALMYLLQSRCTVLEVTALCLAALSPLLSLFVCSIWDCHGCTDLRQGVLSGVEVPKIFALVSLWKHAVFAKCRCAVVVPLVAVVVWVLCA